MLRRILPLLLIVSLTSCRLPSIVPQVPQGGPSGPYSTLARAESSLKIRLVRELGVQALDDSKFEKLVDGATISLIDAETGHTQGTSVTTEDGTFILNFGEGFQPVDGRFYYLDLVKGWQARPEGPFNQAGADALRLRNILCYDAAAAGWKSLMNPTPSQTVDIGNKSTAVSIALALKQQAGELVDLMDFLGVVPYPEDYPEAGVGTLARQNFDQAYAAVVEAIEKDADPLQYLVYDTITGQYFGSLVLFSLTDIFRKGSDANPIREGKVDDRVIITGMGFRSGAKFRLGGKLLPIIGSIAADRVEVQIPPGARSGPVSIELENKTQFGKTFIIRADDGHRTILSEKLYVVNPEWHSVAEVDQSGEVKTLWDKVRDGIPELDAPRQVAVRGGKIYVSCAGSGKILRFDPSKPKVRDTTYMASVTDPHGLAFDTAGNLFVSSKSTGTVLKLNAAGTPIQTYEGFDKPIALAFNYEGRLFVAQEDGGIRRATLTPKLNLEDWGWVSNPLGIAVDSAGEQFISSNDNNAIYRITAGGAMSVFTLINKPGGLSFDDDGNLYVSDTERSLVSRLSPSGNSKILAYGISDPRGIAVDPQSPRTLFVSLGASNAILKVKPDDGSLEPFVTGIANPMSLNFRGNGMFVAHPETGTVSFVRRSGEMETVATGIPYPGGADQEVTSAGVRKGPLYAARFGDLEKASEARLPNYRSGLLPDSGDHYGLDIFQNGVHSEYRRWHFHQKVRNLVVDSEGNLFLVNPTDRTLVMMSKHVETSGTKYARLVRRLALFAKTPGLIMLDPAENVYVVVQDEKTIYRFVKARNYAMEAITGFEKPRGLTFSDSTSPMVMFVSDAENGGRIYRVTNPQSATTRDAAVAVPINPNVQGIAYMPGASTGNGTLYITNDKKIDKVSVVANTPQSDLQTVFDQLPLPWLAMFAHKHPTAGSSALYGYMNTYYIGKLTLGPPVRFSYHYSSPTDSKYNGFFFRFSGANRTEWISFVNEGGIQNVLPKTVTNNVDLMITTREVELVPDKYLYVASPTTQYGEGGVLRIDLKTNDEFYLRLRAYSLGRDTAADMLYIGAYDKGIYKLEPSGRTTKVWTVAGGRPYGLDVYTNAASPAASRVWAAVEDSSLFEGRIQAGTTESHRVGMKGPVF